MCSGENKQKVWSRDRIVQTVASKFSAATYELYYTDGLFLYMSLAALGQHWFYKAHFSCLQVSKSRPLLFSNTKKPISPLIYTEKPISVLNPPVSTQIRIINSFIFILNLSLASLMMNELACSIYICRGCIFCVFTYTHAGHNCTASEWGKPVSVGGFYHWLEWHTVGGRDLQALPLL